MPHATHAASRHAFVYYACRNRHRGCLTRHLVLNVDWLKPEVSGMVEREDGGFACRQCYEDMVQVGGADKAKSKSKSSERLR